MRPALLLVLAACVDPGGSGGRDVSSTDCPPEDEVDFHLDADRDGWGDESTAVASCTTAGDITQGGDCDDADPDVHPDATETCGDLDDDDCDGTREVVIGAPAESTGGPYGGAIYVQEGRW